MRVIEDLYSLPDEQFRLCVLLTAGYAASRQAVASQSFPGVGLPIPRAEKLPAWRRGYWTADESSGTYMLSLNRETKWLSPQREKVTLSADLARRSLLEREQFGALFLEYLQRFPDVRRLLLNEVTFADLFPDPYYGFGLTFVDHTRASYVTGRFIEGLPKRVRFLPDDDLSEFRVDLMFPFWSRFFDSLVKSGFEIQKRGRSPIGEGAWIGLSIVRLAEVFDCGCFNIPVQALRADPMSFLRRHPLFRLHSQVENLN